MKEKLCFTILLLFSLSCCSTQKEVGSNNQPNHVDKVDSVIQACFSVFDSVVTGRSYSGENLNNAIDIMEDLTGIKSKGPIFDPDIGRVWITQDDYLLWREWIRENSNYLYWDTTNNTIRLSDNDRK